MRHGDPERIYEAQRAGTFARLTQNERLGELDAELWIGRWEREATSRGIERGHAFWDEGWEWITQRMRSE